MVNFPSLLLSIFAHSLFLILLISAQFKTNNEILNGYVINFEFTEYKHIEKKTEKNTNEKLFKSKNFYKKKVTLNANVNSEISKVVDDFQIKKKKSYIPTQVIPKEKKIFKTKVTPKEKKIFKFEDKKIKVQSFAKKPLFQSNSSEQRMSKFSFNNENNNYNLQLYKDKKSQYKNVRSCRYNKKVKSKNNPENTQIKIIDNKQITISELLGNNYYNPKLININHLLKMPQIQHKYHTNITNLLAIKKQNIILCN